MKLSRKFTTLLAAAIFAGAIGAVLPSTQTTHAWGNDDPDEYMDESAPIVSGENIRSRNFNIPFSGKAVAKRNAKVYKIVGRKAKAIKTIKKNSKWTVHALKNIRPTDYYNLGGNQYVKASDVRLLVQRVVRVKSKKGTSVISAAGEPTVVEHKLKFRYVTGTIHVLGTAKIEGKSYYNFGTDEYIAVSSAK